MAFSQGTRLGPYAILGPFGAGGQGEVYRATDTRLGRSVAIKCVKGDLGSDPPHRARVEREARIVAQLSHPNICALHDILQEDGHTYLVMEALERQTLATRLLGRNGRGLPRQEALTIAAAVADGLAFAHQHGVVHQDVKPSNIMQRGALMRISVADQVSNVVAAGVSGRGTWGATGVILLVHGGRLKRIDVRDGAVADLRLSANAAARLDAPTFLPDGEHFLYLQLGAELRAGVYAGGLSDLEPTFVIAADSGAILSLGELFFVRGSDLLAVPFDSRSRAAVGDPRIVQKGVARFNYSLSAFTISGTGAIATLVGLPGGRQLAWFTLDGARVAAVPDSEGYNNPVISRDGARVTADRVDPRSGLSGIWVVDLKRGIGSQITDGKAGYQSSVWSPDGTRLAFTRLPDSSAIVMDLATQHVTTLDVAGIDVVPGDGVNDWTPDSRSLLLQRFNTQKIPISGSCPWMVRPENPFPIPRLSKPTDSSRLMGAGWRSRPTAPVVGKPTCSASHRLARRFPSLTTAASRRAGVPTAA